MISSRCLDSIQLAGKPVHLSELRIKLKQTLESEQLLNSPLFEILPFYICSEPLVSGTVLSTTKGGPQFQGLM